MSFKLLFTNSLNIFHFSSLLSCSKLIAYNQAKGFIVNINRKISMPSSSAYLIDDPRYLFLKNDLQLERKNDGVYNGKWFGSGPVVQSIGKFHC